MYLFVYLCVCGISTRNHRTHKHPNCNSQTNFSSITGKLFLKNKMDCGS